jgi:DNA-binding MarR family transcriptional regulator
MNSEELADHLMTFHIAYRNLVAGPDVILARVGLGRAHHRVLFIVARDPGITMGNLSEQLRVTAQALHKTLKQLVSAKMVLIDKCEIDARVKRLRLTDSGRRLEKRVTGLQIDIFRRTSERLGTKNLANWSTCMKTIAEEAMIAQRPRRFGKDAIEK